jgi:penicillin-binding protein 1A
VVDVARRFGITTRCRRICRSALGAADMKLLEHVSAFTVFPERRHSHRSAHDSPRGELRRRAARRSASGSARRDLAGRGAHHDRHAGRSDSVWHRHSGACAWAPSGGKTGTTQDYTDAWFIGFTPQITAGVWVGYDDKQISLGKKETGAKAALPIWLEFMQGALAGMPSLDFPNVVPLEEQAVEHHVIVDTPDSAPTEAEEPRSAPKEKPSAAPPAGSAPKKTTAGAAPAGGNVLPASGTAAPPQLR